MKGILSVIVKKTDQIFVFLGQGEKTHSEGHVKSSAFGNRNQQAKQARFPDNLSKWEKLPTKKQHNKCDPDTHTLVSSTITMEPVHCSEILLAWSLEGDWSFMEITHVQCMWSFTIQTKSGKSENRAGSRRRVNKQ